jgi:hypothetical protein
MQQRLYFLPLPQGQGSLRPTLLAASAGAGLVAPDPLDGPASRRGGRLIVVVQAVEEGRAGDLQQRPGPSADGRPQRPGRQSRDQTVELVVPEQVRRGGQEGIDLQATRDACEHARPAGDLVSVAIEPPLAAPMGRQEEDHGLPLPGKTAVRDGPHERPDHVARHARRELGDEARVREESRALDQVTGLHGNPGVESGQGGRGECPREIASDALSEQAVHLRGVPGDLAGQRLDRVPRQAGRLGPKNKRMRFLRSSHWPRPIARSRTRPRASGGMSIHLMLTAAAASSTGTPDGRAAPRLDPRV